MRRHIPALSLLGSLIFLPACATKQGESGHETSAARDAGELTQPRTSRKKIEVIRLRHAVASDLASVVSDLITDAREGRHEDEPRALADPQLNAVILFGNADERSKIRELVVQLDVPPKAE